MNNLNYKIAVFVLLAVMVSAFTHCVQNAPIGGSSSSSSRSPSSSTTSTQTPEQVLNQAQVEVGLRSFEQINYTFAELTGVPVSNGTINSTYSAVEASLPTDNDVKVLQSSNMVAISRLASEYCNQLISSGSFNTDRDRIFGAGLFSIVPSRVDERAMVEMMTNALWGKDVIDPAELDNARKMLEQLFVDISKAEADNTAATVKITKGVCTAALSSAYVTMM
jgi:hypothetical protein